MNTRLWLRVLTATTVWLAAAHVAWASEDESPSLFAGDLGNAVWTLIIFVLLLVVLGRFAWGPILKALQKREEFIHDSLNRARNDRQQAEQHLRKIEQRLGAAKDEAGVILDQGRKNAETLQRQLEQEARAEAEAMIERAKREIGLARDSAVKELYDLTAMLATEAAGRIIRKELDAGEHQRLIAEAIAEMAGANRSEPQS